RGGKGRGGEGRGGGSDRGGRGGRGPVTFPVDQAADHHHGEGSGPRSAGLRGELGGVDSVGDDRDGVGAERGPQHGVLLAGVGDAHHVVGVAQRHGQQLVGQHRADVSEAEQRVVREDGAQAQRARVEERVVRERREGAVRVHQRDALAHQHPAHQRQAVEERTGRRLVVHDPQRQVVDLEAVAEVADPAAGAVRVAQHDHLVAPLDQALRQLVDVALHPAHVRVEEVRHHAHPVFAAARRRRRGGGSRGRQH
ncbi:hypothetical protein chiPu_0030327, partial [Chiloscyllium punctatum]|nr:hypothetical protein [Chiloscyllium punctatum]